MPWTKEKLIFYIILPVEQFFSINKHIKRAKTERFLVIDFALIIGCWLKESKERFLPYIPITDSFFARVNIKRLSGFSGLGS